MQFISAAATQIQLHRECVCDVELKKFCHMPRRVFTSYKSINILSIHISKFTCVCVVQQLNNGAAIISGSNILYAQFSIHFLLATVDHLHYLNIQLKWRTGA